jgi:hypothetical protein
LTPAWSALASFTGNSARITRPALVA